MESLSPTASVAESPAATPAATTAYIIKKGDTLIGLAKRFHITLDQLQRANPDVTDPTKLRIGQKLEIPAAP